MADKKVQGMTPDQFYNLDEIEQAEVVWDGEYIGGREDEEHNILLYQIGDLYVKVYHHKEYNVIRKFNAFTILEVLDIYTNKIIEGNYTN